MELTTFEMGHFNGYPLRVERYELLPGTGGAFATAGAIVGLSGVASAAANPGSVKAEADEAIDEVARFFQRHLS